jgi:hypothetical protein
MNADHPKADDFRVLAPPAKRQLVGHGKKDERVGRRVPVRGQIGVPDREVERRVRSLTGLDSWGQISPGDQIQARGTRTLAIRHIASIPASASCVTFGAEPLPAAALPITQMSDG